MELTVMRKRNFLNGIYVGNDLVDHMCILFIFQFLSNSWSSC